MVYTAKNNFKHGEETNIGVLLLNLGTPNAPTTAALKIYLKEFLSNQRIIEPPPARRLWLLLLKAIILQTRPKKSAVAYSKIWNTLGTGSPLLAMSTSLINKVVDQLQTKIGTKIKVELAMRYGSPNISNALNKLRDKGMNKLLVLPLFPQYSATTTASCFDKVFAVLSS